MIPVTKSFLPPIDEYMAQIERAFKNEWLTNRGELVKELELKVHDYLALNESNILITNNGTIPLQIALKLFGQQGEIITTPFSYVASTSAIVWENCTPVFVDINSDNLTIDETKIEASITKKTTCILATHVFGNPCNIEKIDSIANKYGIKVIYDAAHCFGVKYNNKSIFEYGDISTCSFHATKLFHTGEGGAIFSKDKNVQNQLFYSHNFGHDGPQAYHGLGINGKISELQAAMGLSVLPYMNQILNERKKVVDYYNQELNFKKIKRIKISASTEWNYSYYPIIFENENDLLKLKRLLNTEGIFPRRYFYPSLNKLPYVHYQHCEVSEEISNSILCLPLFVGMKTNTLETIKKCING